MTDYVDYSRRRFIGRSAMLGSGLLAGVVGDTERADAAEGGVLRSRRPDVPYDLNDPENAIYSTCLNCNTGCGVKVKLQEGVVAKIDGNPYSPWTMVPHVPMATTVDDAARVDGALCPKGQAGVQTVYDPYRIRTVLKRAGKRGENRWETIPFDQAVTEIAEGGKLFAHVPGEENRDVEGLRSIMALRDASAAKAMASDVAAIWKGSMTVAEFQARHAEFLDTLIDPDHPDLGAKNNQFVLAWGRLKGGRKEFFTRFGGGFGTNNLHGHTTVCQGSLYFTCKAISEQYQDGKFSGGKKFYWQADTENARYILFAGANLFEANYGPTNRTVRLTENLVTGRTKIAVVDPRYSKLASKADVWLPIKPGEDPALALAMIRWTLEHERYDAGFLRAANKAGAVAAGETSWTNATWLVEVHDGKPGKFVRASRLGLTRDPNALVVMQNGRPVAVDPNDERVAVNGDLFADTSVSTAGGDRVHVKTALQLLREEAERHTFAAWCDIAGVRAADAERVVHELTSHGKRAVIDLHRGPAQHTNGFYGVFAWMSLNMLLGNFDWKGGLVKATKHSHDGAKGGPFNLTTIPGKLSAFGVDLIRRTVAYDKSTLFDGYPARRNWYPLASDVYQEIVPSIGDAYPYPIKALFLYMGTPAYALPAGHTNIDVLADVEKLPLFFASDITVGTSTMYADYIFPDLTWLERWEFQGSHPNIPNKVGPVRQPAVAPIPETVTVYGAETPISLESLLMAVAEKLGLGVFGPDAFGPGLDLRHPDDFYLRAVANIAAGTKAGTSVPDADARELEVFLAARRHLPKSVFDADRWRGIVGDDLWAKVVYVLNRGGRFEQHADGYDGDRLRHRYAALLNMYQEKTAGHKYSGTGMPYPGIATHVPIRSYNGDGVDALSDGYDLHLITNRVITQTKSRTIGNYWLQPIMPENGIVINSVDARRLGLEHGDEVRVVSATNAEGVWDLKHGRQKPIRGKVVVTETIRPGVISFALGFGHWATGATDIVIDGDRIKGDPRRAAGVHANAAMWTDPGLRHNTCLVDPVGGSVSFYDTKVRLEQVRA